MKRLISKKLFEWKNDIKRKPLLLRGARQVGKTFIVRELGKIFDNFVEINFELLPQAKKTFELDLLPSRIIKELSLLLDAPIIPGKTLLFLDEIQESTQAIASLRYFYEMLPELAVIAAGSLLDFQLENTGLPVGRIASLYMYPVSFMEFLKAGKHELLMEEILSHDPANAINEAVHKKLFHLLGQYLAIGGMPEAVNCWFETGDMKECSKIHHVIVDNYRQDFNKYAKKYQIKYVDILFKEAPRFLGKKFKFSNISKTYRKRELDPALVLLMKAGIVHKIVHSSGHGLPLGVESEPERFKILFLDIALAQSLLGLDAVSWLLAPEKHLINNGAIAEAFVGQEILAYSPPDQKAELYYWHKEERSSNAEVDFLIQKQGQIQPVEVKSGAVGILKSLSLFLKTHPQSNAGIRLYGGNYSFYNNIYSYPLYAVAGMLENNKEILIP